MGEFGTGRGVRQLECLDEHAGLLIAKDVAANGLAKGLGVAIDIENVVLNLECQPDMNTKQVERLLLVLVGTGDIRTHLQRGGE